MPRFEGRRGAIVAAAAAVLVLALVPRFAGTFAVVMLSDVYMVAAFAVALNLIAGYGGYPAFGNVVFFGIGAYATGIVQANLHGPFFAGALAATIASVALALVMGPVFFRLRGHYFAIGTLGLNGVVAQLVKNLPLSGGAKGLSLPVAHGSPAHVAVLFNEFFLAALALTVLVTYLVVTGRAGFACRALRTDESVAESLGVDTLGLKVRLWALSAALTGLLGAIYAYSLTYIEPGDVFNLGLSVKAFVIMLLGGTATLVGPLVAAAFVEGAIALSQHVTLNYDTGLLGLIIIVAVTLFPRGLSAYVAGRRAARAQRVA